MGGRCWPVGGGGPQSGGGGEGIPGCVCSRGLVQCFRCCFCDSCSGLSRLWRPGRLLGRRRVCCCGVGWYEENGGGCGDLGAGCCFI